VGFGFLSMATESLLVCIAQGCRDRMICVFAE